MAHPTLQYLPFMGLIAGYLMLWIPSLKPLWLAAVLISLTTALYTEVIEDIALPYIIVLLLVSLWQRSCQSLNRSSIASIVAPITLVLISLAFGTHWIPGFHRLKIFDQVRLSAISTTFPLYLNFDKSLAGLVLLATVTPIATNVQQWKDVTTYTKKGSLMAIFILLPFAIILGVIAWNPKLPSWFPIWLVVNLFLPVLRRKLFFAD